MEMEFEPGDVLANRFVGNAAPRFVVARVPGRYLLLSERELGWEDAEMFDRFWRRVARGQDSRHARPASA